MGVVLALVRPRLYYGWYIVGLALLAQFIGVGTQAYAFGVFLKPMTEELGWSRGDFSLAQTLSTVAMGATGFVLGPLVDRYGGRWLMIFGAVVAGFSIIGLAVVQELWQFYLIRSLFFVIGSACMGNLVVNIALSKWFVRQRGTAIAIAAMGTSVGGMVMTPMTTVLIESLGWRSAWVMLGILTWAVMILPTAFFMKRQPEDMGLLPDGDTPESLTATRKDRPIGRQRSASSEEHWTPREAARTKQLWLLIIAWGIANVGLGAFFLHMIPFLRDNDFSSGVAAFLLSAQAMASFLSKPIWGYLVDRLVLRYLAAIAFAFKGVALGLLPLAILGHGLEATLILVLLFGVSAGCTIPLQETMWANYFGRRYIGAVRSLAMPFSIIFGAGGSWFAGFMWDVTGGYAEAFTIFAALSFVGMVLILLTLPPRRPATASPTSLPEGFSPQPSTLPGA